LTHTANIYPHHDLLNLAFYHFEIINEKTKSDESEGIGLDCTSCLIALSIGVEGLINFCGDKLVSNWNERNPYHKKLKKVAKAIKLEFDVTVEPLLTLSKLKKLRDELAHPKPLIKSGKINNKNELNKLMETSWDSFCNPDFVQHAFKQVNEFEKIIYSIPLIQQSGILTSASGWGGN
jgi:hypothetical protein